jgi:[CysO sulfur-carrier protein]-S-L-cysteine hydrolase
MNSIRLPRSIVNQLLHLTQKSPDEEICGLISRDSRGFRQCYPVPNRATDRKHFFALDPKAQIDAMRAMREHGEELAGIYHSHPDSPPFPSPADVAQHEHPDVLYLIISLSARNVPEMRGFYIHGQAIEKVVLGIEEEAAR